MILVNLNDLHAIWLPHSWSIILILYIHGELELRVFKEKSKVQATSYKHEIEPPLEDYSALTSRGLRPRQELLWTACVWMMFKTAEQMWHDLTADNDLSYSSSTSLQATPRHPHHLTSWCYTSNIKISSSRSKPARKSCSSKDVRTIELVVNCRFIIIQAFISIKYSIN